MRRLASVFLLLLFPLLSTAMEAEQLYYALRTKVLSVRDYTADVKVTLDVNYMKIPPLEGKLYYKVPDKIRMVRKDGISILPKKNMSLSLGNLIPAGKVSVIDAGTANLHGKTLRVLKVIPEDDKSGIILSKIWIDEANLLALHTETTTQNDGTVTMDLVFGKYVKQSLPDKVTITMDIKEYKLPKGITMDYSEVPTTAGPKKPQGDSKGNIIINYSNYVVNKGVDDGVFVEK